MADRLEQLASLPPQSKAAKVRAYMPEIERRLADGVSRQAIIEWLAEGGIEMSLPTFKSYLQRYRSSKARSASKPTGSSSTPHIPASGGEISPVRDLNTDRNTGPDHEPIPDGNSDGEIPAPEPETVTAPDSSLNDILDPRKRDANTDQYMQRKPVLIGRNRSEKK